MCAERVLLLVSHLLVCIYRHRGGGVSDVTLARWSVVCCCLLHVVRAAREEEREESCEEEDDEEGRCAVERRCTREPAKCRVVRCGVIV